MAEFWPTSDDAYAAPMNDITKRDNWPDSRIARGDLARPEQDSQNGG